MNAKQKLRSYIITVFIALAFVATVLVLNGFFEEKLPVDRLVNLSDAFLIAGVFILGAGGIVWAAGLGTFDMMGYSIRLTLDSAFAFKKDWKKKEDFYQYRQRKSKARAEYKNLLFVGVAMLMISFYALIIKNLTF